MFVTYSTSRCGGHCGPAYALVRGGIDAVKSRRCCRMTIQCPYQKSGVSSLSQGSPPLPCSQLLADYKDAWASLRQYLPRKRGWGMTRVVEGFHSLNAIHTFIIERYEPRLCLCSWSWSSFTDHGGMEGWVEPFTVPLGYLTLDANEHDPGDLQQYKDIDEQRIHEFDAKRY